MEGLWSSNLWRSPAERPVHGRLESLVPDLPISPDKATLTSHMQFL